MKYTLYTILLLLSTINIVSAADTPEAMASPYYDKALIHVPQGADITEIIPTRATYKWDGTQTFYIKFDFDGRCYLGYVAVRYALTAIPCG